MTTRGPAATGEGTGAVTLAAVSGRQRISLSYLEQLFGKLRRHKLVDSVRGPGGGYCIAKPLELVPVADILYLKADLKYVTARTREREYLLDESLMHLETEFAARFIRLHRSALVAKDAITGFERNTAEDADTNWLALLRDVPEKLPVSRRQWPQVKSYAKQLST